MTTFSKYAKYYDLLYKDKDYAAEAQYVIGLINAHAPGATSILEIGCGTGRHARQLVAAGFSVHGVDLSQDMLRDAERGRSGLPNAVGARLSFSQGDARVLDVGRRFNVAMALFHVVSYQATNKDVSDAFRAVNRHLESGGIFVFDCWYGPAVMTERPAVRVKELEDANTRVLRIAEPVLHPNSNVVDVKYRVFIEQGSNGVVEEIRETHRMRYFFLPEIALICEQQGFTLVDAQEWMTGAEPDFNTWSVCFVVKKR